MTGESGGGEGNFPFVFVQLANWDAPDSVRWPIIREAQRHALSVSNTAMAVAIDVGDSHNVHPANKQAIGERMSLAARALAYGEPIEYSGPLYEQTSVDEHVLHVWFTHARGLIAKGGAPIGFELAGADHKYYAASGRIDGNSIVLSSSQVQFPVYVRYGWANDPKTNLYNAAGLPASPFTNDDVY